MANNGNNRKYRPEYAEQYGMLLSFGCSKKQIASFFGVTDKTLTNWEEKYEEFKNAAEAFKPLAVSKVYESLLRRACGYNCKETKVFCVNGEIVEHTIDKHVPASVAAAKLLIEIYFPEKLQEQAPETVINNYITDRPDATGATVDEWLKAHKPE